MNIGLIGTQNSHSSAFGKAFNIDRIFPDCAITHVWGETADNARERAEEAQIPQVLADAAAMVGQVDALIIDTRDGANHLDFADLFLGTGIPIYIDKPLATDAEKAAAFLARASAAGTRVASHSVIPLQRSFQDFLVTAQELAPLRYLGLSMPAGIDSEYSGMFFYVVHAVECLCALLDRLPARVRVERFAGTALATLDYADGPLATINLQEGNYTYHLLAVGDQEAKSLRVDYDENPYLTGIHHIHDFFTGATPPPTTEHLLMPVRILTALEASKRNGGWVAVK